MENTSPEVAGTPRDRVTDVLLDCVADGLLADAHMIDPEPIVVAFVHPIVGDVTVVDAHSRPPQIEGFGYVS